MRPLLKLLYLANKKVFYEFFVEEFVGEIPEKIQEPSMAFLANGKEKLEKWCMFMSYVIQKRISKNPKDISENTGMLMMLRLFSVLVMARPAVTVETRGEPTAYTPDPTHMVDAAITGLKEKFHT